MAQMLLRLHEWFMVNICNSVVNVRHKFRLEEKEPNNALQLCTRCSAGTSAVSSPAAC